MDTFKYYIYTLVSESFSGYFLNPLRSYIAYKIFTNHEFFLSGIVFFPAYHIIHIENWFLFPKNVNYYCTYNFIISRLCLYSENYFKKSPTNIYFKSEMWTETEPLFFVRICTNSEPKIRRIHVLSLFKLKLN